MEETQTFQNLKKYIDANGLTHVTYGRDQSHQPFVQMLHKVFPELTKCFLSKFSTMPPAPVFSEMIKLQVDQAVFGLELESKIVTFYIQTILGDTFPFVNTAAKPEKDTYSFNDVVMSDTYENINNLYTYLVNYSKPKSQKSFIYTWNSMYGRWEQDQRKMYNKNIADLVGLDDIFNQIKKDIMTYRKHKDHLVRLGESNGMNYMFYGAPGTGKSSLVRALAMDLGLPVYVVKMTGAINENQITNMLIPGTGGGDYDDDLFDSFEDEDGNFNLELLKDFKIVLLEDFDRYLQDSRSASTMSAILNALDGIFPSFGIIRFFSANNPESLAKNKALTTRLNKAFFFAKPNPIQMEKQVLNAYRNKQIDPVKLAEFVEYIKTKDMNMRQLTHFLCQYLDSENPLEDVVTNMDKWISDMIAFSICKDTDNPENNSDNDDEVVEVFKPINATQTVNCNCTCPCNKKSKVDTSNSNVNDSDNDDQFVDADEVVDLSTITPIPGGRGFGRRYNGIKASIPGLKI